MYCGIKNNTYICASIIKTMPEIFNLYGFSFFFWSREHEPVHVHVEGSDGYATYDWNEEMNVFVERECYNIKAGDLKKIKKAIDARRQEIFDKWNEHFNK